MITACTSRGSCRNCRIQTLNGSMIWAKKDASGRGRICLGNLPWRNEIFGDHLVSVWRGEVVGRFVRGKGAETWLACKGSKGLRRIF